MNNNNKGDWTSKLLTFGAVAAATAVSVFALAQQHNEHQKMEKKNKSRKEKLIDLGKYSPFFGDDDRTRLTLKALTKRGLHRRSTSTAVSEAAETINQTKNMIRGFNLSDYDNLHVSSSAALATGEYFSKCTAQTLYHILSCLPLEDLIRLSHTCTCFHAYVDLLLKDRHYMKLNVENAGLNKRYRGKLWQVVAKCPTMTAKKRDMYWKLNQQQSQLEDEIIRDACRTLIHYEFFESNEVAIETLSRLLKTYSVHDPEVGYTQGMNFIAAFLLIHLPEEEAYWMLYTLMISGRYRIRGMFTRGLPCLKLCVYQFQYLFDLHLPKLARQFRKLKIFPELFVTEWFLTIYTYRSIPIETSARIWDMFLLDGWKILHRIGLALLYLSQDALIKLSFEDAVHHMKSLPDQTILEPRKLLHEASHFKVTNALLYRLALKYVCVDEEEYDDNDDDDEQEGY